MQINEAVWPATTSSLANDLRTLGVKEGMVLIVHSSLSSLGRWVVGGPVAVVLALQQALGEKGTLVMPAHNCDLSDPAQWENPPVPQAWWNMIRDEMPAYDPQLTPTSGMGMVAECFRKQHGVLRSGHPQVSFAARGPHAANITSGHSPDHGLGERSPLARLYDADGWVLLLGVHHDKNTSLHLAEYRADYPAKKQTVLGAPIHVDGARAWVHFDDIEYDSDDFVAIGEAFERECASVTIGQVGGATARLMPQRALVDYAVRWMERHRT
ncbi:SPbeta prophage-derived aminoglycoside N(3')-acetyltransferase-like protein YokD [Paenibacillus solanacearum]|uniref:Aminoglycoside N(3)-acetyltransferase n=1 Tax=Paenibacillus solanacearum TaxID=2048548 RepID=A0A916NWX8_9BACL|nr:AAC(3) family N-acetyltransferase [Paenibacillus solanacearum]CAG7620727.1 SPbeta prophage-derived aminoglycoside N(3')-acetyltransferase-like protein YokD [Paenibacillus solanacearum]